MKPGNLYRFRDTAFIRSSVFSRLNGQNLVVLRRVPPDCPPWIEPYGVDILVNGEVLEWSTNILSRLMDDSSEDKERINEAG